VFTFPGLRPWRPANYDNDYAGPVTWHRALAESRNVAAVKVASWAGVSRVAALWEAASGQSVAHVFPSLTLGAVEATPADVATAYAAFATGGLVRPLRTIADVVENDRSTEPPAQTPQRIARASTTFVVTDMMRAVLNEGTARSARAAGFIADAAGKTGTTDNLRDAWFAGFTADLLAVVWVGRDDDHPLGLTGAQAALPIWTDFMKHAIQEHSP
jgi:penicillin-binding protein 1B